MHHKIRLPNHSYNLYSTTLWYTSAYHQCHSHQRKCQSSLPSSSSSPSLGYIHSLGALRYGRFVCVKRQSKLPFLSPLQDFPYLVDMVWENRPGDFQDVDMVNCSIHLCLLHQWMLHLQCKRDFIDFTDHNPHNFKASNVLLCNNYPWHCEDDSSSKWKVNHLKYARAHVFF